MSKHTNLEHLITEFNSCKTVDNMIKFCENMISQYTAGKQEIHLKTLRAIKFKVDNALMSDKNVDRWAKRELSRMVGNVCLEDKVI